MNLIVAVDKNWGIGKNNGLLFRLPKDMAFFRQTTTGKTVVVGANTFESFPHGALPNRTNIVLDACANEHIGAISVSSLSELEKVLQNFSSDDVFVIGGASVYKLLLNRCKTAYVTKVDADGCADTFFPDLDNLPEWHCTQASEPVSDNGYMITFCTYANSNFDQPI